MGSLSITYIKTVLAALARFQFSGSFYFPKDSEKVDCVTERLQ